MPVLNPELTATRTGDESELLARAQAGDKDAFCRLCRLHSGGLLRHATALCRDAATAEDLVQETLVEAWKSLPRFNGQSRAFTWFCSILLHRHRNVIRKRIALPFSFLLGTERELALTRLEGLRDPGLLPNETAEAAEQAVRILRSLEALPRKQRDVVFLRFYAQDSLAGIASALNCSVGTVKSRLFKGLERLRRMRTLADGIDL